MIHLTGGTMAAYNFSFPPFETNVYAEKGVRPIGTFEDNTPVVWGRFLSEEPPFGLTRVPVKSELAFDVVFDERSSPAAGEWSVIGTLQASADRVSTVLTTLGRDVFRMDPCLPDPFGPDN